MSTGDNKRSIIVAIFVSLGILILVSGIFILGGQQKRFEKTIRLKAVFDDVSGLRKGNNVWFSGVKIGTVNLIEFKGNSQVEITMKIEADAQQYIRKDAKVKVSSESVIGNKILLIYGGSTEISAVDDGDQLESESPLSTEDMMTTLQETNKNLVGITRDLKELSFGLVNGKGTVGALLNDSSMAINIQRILSNLNTVSANTVRASSALSSFTGKMNTEGGLANELLTDTAVFSQSRTAVAQLQQTTVNAAEATGNLSQASTKLNQKDNGVGVLLNDEKFASQLQTTMGNLDPVLKNWIKHGSFAAQFPFGGFFKKKAKKEAKNRDDSAYK